MKKTEKIEIRLSHEDKERLNRIAESEGRTISQIVRGLIDRYMDLNTANNDRGVSVKDKAKWGILGALLSALIFVALSFYKTAEEETFNSKEVVIILWPKDGAHSIAKFFVPLTDNFSETTELHANENLSFEIKTKVSPSEKEGRFMARFEICETKENECTDANLYIENTTSAGTEIYDQKGNRFTIAIS